MKNLWKSFIKNCPRDKNWDSYGADPPNKTSLNNARVVFDKLKEFSLRPVRILPTVEGGVNFTFIYNNKYAHIECYNDGETLYVTEDGEKVTTQEINIEDSNWLVEITEHLGAP